MVIAKWAAAAVTLLMGLANAGLVSQDNRALQLLGPALAVAAVGAVLGLLTAKSWGATAVIAIGGLNLVGSLVGAVTGLDGWPVGLVLSVLAIVLTVASRPSVRRSAMA